MARSTCLIFGIVWLAHICKMVASLRTCGDHVIYVPYIYGCCEGRKYWAINKQCCSNGTVQTECDSAVNEVVEELQQDDSAMDTVYSYALQSLNCVWLILVVVLILNSLCCIYLDCKQKQLGVGRQPTHRRFAFNPHSISDIFVSDPADVDDSTDEEEADYVDDNDLFCENVIITEDE
eukprot:CAMPEP_0202706148 /NCGR_PEP_ID=MMETSP1385-20130828/18609_1 /ASSEMBLY_ACC=CAM_ASM_000861 /TAXON_ID=933848 /ORGANISM="Elphidium margaritaceum" /LENGTH=177 /DNA_ID=CAMNT_0049364551 /DNA_START=50 /DNA_END=583 /DNA_ORIENTATION=+